ncbi:hypothetical protein [Halobacillus sp. Nhm2S1]|uniref:hypothetical protein n=1 Tax=Halobacillus sp. Nhm2S1 TaxID=2866716 RepID=UPI001C7373B9|nr:hypothetical protein [Halobacillus sp. Nhm2S1]MBX0359158.1 hypothetical protein [Halobacillus sp. Nhm2S1]
MSSNMSNYSFLNFWFQGTTGFIEVRIMKGSQMNDRRFIEVEDLEEHLVHRLIETGSVSNTNVYFGVTTRGQKEGKEKNIKDVPGLWVDIDPKHSNKEDAIQKVNNLPTPPSVIISSGNGIHAYFKFDTPFIISSEKDREQIKELTQRIHKYTNADDTSDLPRLLRMPGSWNYKEETNAKRCEIIEFTGAVYSLKDFDYLSSVETKNPKVVERIKVDSYSQIDLDDIRVHMGIRNLILEGGEYGTRSDKVFAVICSMLENGHSPSEIAFTLTNPDWRISEKVLERPIQHQRPYLENTITNAWQKVQDKKNLSSGEGTNYTPTEIIVQSGCYFRDKKRLSNFIFKPTERILTDETEVLKGDIVVNDGTPIPTTLDYKALITKKELLTAINSSKVSWLGGDKDIQYLREYLLTIKVTEKTGVNKIGLHDGMFITNNECINHEGIVKKPNLVFISKFINSPIPLERSTSLKMINEWEHHASEILRLLPSINEAEVIYPIIGWHFASPLAPLIRKIADGGFPQLMMWGTKGSGKTSTAQLFGKLFGNDEIRSCSRPPFSIIREMDTLNAVPLYLDEYRPLQMNRNYLSEIKGLALNAYKATYDSRGHQSQSTIDYQYTSPIVWIGETPFDQPNLIERIVLAKLSPNTLSNNKEYKTVFRQLNKTDSSVFLGGYVQWILNKIHNGQVNLEDTFNSHKEYLDDYYELPERISINIAITLTGLSLFETLAGELAVELSIPFPTIIQEQVIQLTGEEAKSSLDQALEHTATMVGSSNNFIYGIDYTFNRHSGELVFVTKRWFAELRKFCKEYNYHEDVLSDKQFRNFLSENKNNSGYIKERYSAKRTLDSKQQRCSIIDPYQLEKELGIPVDTWER